MERDAAPRRLRYHDFNLELSNLSAEGVLSVRVIGKTPGGAELRADQAESVAFRADDFRALVGKLERRKASEQELIALGEALAALALPGRVRSLLERSLEEVRRKGEGLRLRLRVEPLALAALPWEYLLLKRGEPSLASDFLCLARDVSVTRHEVTGVAPGPVTSKRRYKITAALANPVGELPVLEVEKDRDAIRAAVDALNAQTNDAVELVVVEGATRAAVVDAIANSDIFHFSGHGVFESAGLNPDGSLSKRGKLVLETSDGAEDRIGSDELSVLLGSAGIRLIVLGACNTATRDAGGAWSGVAPALVREGIPAVVAMQFRVADAGAIRFLGLLYAGVLAGLTIDEAVAEGRAALFTERRAGSSWADGRDWGVPVLYLRADDGVLFPALASEDAANPSPGARILGCLQVRTVEGHAAAVKIGTLSGGGHVEGRARADSVKQGGTLIGVEIENLNGEG